MTEQVCPHGLDVPHMWKKNIVDEEGHPDYMFGYCMGPWENTPTLWHITYADGATRTYYTDNE